MVDFTSLNDAYGAEADVSNNMLTEVLRQTGGATGSWENAPAPSEVQTPLTSVYPDTSELLRKTALDAALVGLASGIAPPADAAPRDPLAADKNGWNRPKTGKVDTEGSVQRINARAKVEGTGVTATRDANGQVSITNLSPTGGANNANVIGRQVAAGPLGMTEALKQLRLATTVADAQVMMDSIRQTAVAEQASLAKTALSFASNKLGIPGMEQQLAQAEMADKADPEYYPGIGDSPITKGVRAQLQALRGQAAGQADEFLATNMASGTIKNTLIAAQEAMTAVKVKEQRKETLTDNTELRRQDKREAQEQNAADVLESMNAKDLGMLKILNPSLQNDNQIAMAKAVQELAKPAGASKLAAIKAASQTGGQELIALAAENNADAKTLLLHAEKQKNPLADSDETERKLRRIQQFALDPNFVKKSAQAKFGNINSPEAKEYVASMNTKTAAGSTDAKTKSMLHKEKLFLAIDMERQQATNNFIADTTKWGAIDPVWLQAVVETQKARGSASFSDVMTTYIGSSTGMEAQKKLSALSAIVSERAAAQASSVFGQPEPSLIQKMITDKAKSVGIGSAITAMLGGLSKDAPSFATMLAGPFLPRAINSLLDSTGVKVDPVTGKPLQ